MPLTLEQAQAKTQKLFAQLVSRKKEITGYDDYYRGKQPLQYASEHWRNFHGNRYRGFSDNWCATVADAPAERLRTVGIRLSSDTRTGNEKTAGEKQLWEDWLRNDLEQQSSQGYLGTLVSKRSFVLVWGDDDDEPVVTWEDASQMLVEYDPENPRRRRAALKAWTEDTTEYATLYLADEVWKFERAKSVFTNSGGRTAAGLIVPTGVTGMDTGGSWTPRKGIDENPMDNPLERVPVVEFPNRPMLRGEPLSEIQGTAAMQDAINLLWAYLFGSADRNSFPGRVIMGQEMPTIPILDSEGQKIGEKPVDLSRLEQDRFLWLTGQNTKIAEFSQADLSTFTSVIETCVGHVGSQTRTPPHYLSTNHGLANLNADALKAAETGLVKKCEEEQLFLNPSVREVFELMALVRGEEELARAAARGVPLWKDVEIRSDAQLADVCVKMKSIGFPLRWIAEKYGLEPGEIDRVIEMIAEERAMDPLAVAAGLVPPVPDVKPEPEPVPA